MFFFLTSHPKESSFLEWMGIFYFYFCSLPDKILSAIRQQNKFKNPDTTN